MFSPGGPQGRRVLQVPRQGGDFSFVLAKLFPETCQEMSLSAAVPVNGTRVAASSSQLIIHARISLPEKNGPGRKIEILVEARGEGCICFTHIGGGALGDGEKLAESLA